MSFLPHNDIHTFIIFLNATHIRQYYYACINGNWQIEQYPNTTAYYILYGLPISWYWKLITCVIFYVDVDECLDDSTCGSNADCTNVIGSFMCNCSQGYTGDGFTCEGMWVTLPNKISILRLSSVCLEMVLHITCNKHCVEYPNEQLLLILICRLLQDRFFRSRSFVYCCFNFFFQVLIFCMNSLIAKDFYSIDVNECNMMNDCHSMYGLCTNIPGSYECSCKTGFSGDGVDCEGNYILGTL